MTVRRMPYLMSETGARLKEKPVVEMKRVVEKKAWIGEGIVGG
jgi:hypothetical protein